MRRLASLHPLDLAAAAVLLLGLVYAGLALGGRSLTRSNLGAGFLKEVPMRIELRMDPGLASELAAALAPGELEIDHGTARLRIQVLAVSPAADAAGGARLILGLTARADGQGRPFFLEQQLRRGAPLGFGDRSRWFQGTIVSVEALPGPP